VHVIPHSSQKETQKNGRRRKENCGDRVFILQIGAQLFHLKEGESDECGCWECSSRQDT